MHCASIAAALCIARPRNDCRFLLNRQPIGDICGCGVRLRGCGAEGVDPAVREKNWREVFVFFKHEDEGKAPLLARRFLS
jgi:hypothetical protein